MIAAFSKYLSFIAMLSVFAAVEQLAFPRASAYGQADENPTIKRSLQYHLAWTLKALGREAKLGISVVDAATGTPLFEYRAGEQMIPASVLKLFTAFAALKYLGASYRFPTELFSDRAPGLRRGDIGNLFIRGYGDPSMVNERVSAIAQDLRHRGVSSINNIIVDDTLFIDPPGRSGLNPYQAALNAASVNHNCYAVDVTPGKTGGAAVVSLPFTPGVNVQNSVKTKAGKVLISVRELHLPENRKQPGGGYELLEPKPLSLAVSGNVTPRSGVIREYFASSKPTLLYAQVFKHFLLDAGIQLRGTLLRGPVQSSAQVLASYESKDLGEIIIDLNQYSNNFIAGQLLFALGLDSSGAFRLEVGVERVRSVLMRAGISPEGLSMYDGSGLDARNLSTARQITQLLTTVNKDSAVAPVMLSSLSRFGENGTLKHRALARDTKDRPRPAPSAFEAWGKTGTLDNVSSLAGYADTPSGRRLAYAVMINGPVRKSVSKTVENNLVRMLVGLPTEWVADS